MSTSSVSSSQRPYPLSPPPHSEAKQPHDMPFHQPQTPESPLQPISASADKSSPAEFNTQTADRTLPTPAESFKRCSPLSDSVEAGSTMEETRQTSIADVEDNPNKRKRDVGDTGDQDQKKLHVEDRRLGIEDLHLDVGKKYLLCRTPHPRLQPIASRDLFDLYSLNEIASQVARTLPNGEKNKLRKTYKGKIKDLAINGKFDVTVRDVDAPDGLLAMVRHPEEEWAIQNRQGMEIENGLGQAVRISLPLAMTMSKGLVPKSSWDSSVLGELDLPETKLSVVSAPPKPIASGTVQKSLNGSAVLARSGKIDAVRPKRNVMKRGYGESSFEGYGEGYVDDDMADAGYSTAEGEDRGMSQKRRKKSGPSHGYQGPMRHASYGPGMVGA